jgi:hypothetical protein
MNDPLSDANTPDYSRRFVCSTVDHALFPAKSQSKSAADTMKLKPNVVFCPPGSRKGQRYYLPKKRCVKVAIKLTSISKPITASAAAYTTNGLCKFVSLLMLGKKPRP